MFRPALAAAVTAGALAIGDPGLSQELTTNARNIDEAADSEQQEHAWCSDTSKFMQQSSAFVNGFAATLSDQPTPSLDHDFLVFLSSLQNADIAAVNNLVDAAQKMQQVGGRLCRGFEMAALARRTSALDKSLVISRKMSLLKRPVLSQALLQVKRSTTATHKSSYGCSCQYHNTNNYNSEI